MTPQRWQKLKKWIWLGVFAAIFFAVSGFISYRIALAIMAVLEIR